MGWLYWQQFCATIENKQTCVDTFLRGDSSLYWTDCVLLKTSVVMSTIRWVILIQLNDVSDSYVSSVNSRVHRSKARYLLTSMLKIHKSLLKLTRVLVFLELVIELSLYITHNTGMKLFSLWTCVCLSSICYYYLIISAHEQYRIMRHCLTPYDNNSIMIRYDPSLKVIKILMSRYFNH